MKLNETLWRTYTVIMFALAFFFEMSRLSGFITGPVDYFIFTVPAWAMTIWWGGILILTSWEIGTKMIMAYKPEERGGGE